MNDGTEPAPRARKRRGQGHERVEEILAAAKALYAEGGYDFTTTRRIAERVGVSQTALYTHFPDKDAILTAVCDRAFHDLEARLVAAEATAGSRDRVFEALLRAYLAFAFSVPTEYAITFMAPRPAATALPPPERPGIGLHAFRRFRDQIAALMAEGHVREGDPDTVAQAAWAALHGLAALLITLPRFPWVERAALVDTLVAGLVRGHAATTARR